MMSESFNNTSTVRSDHEWTFTVVWICHGIYVNCTDDDVVSQINKEHDPWTWPRFIENQSLCSRALIQKRQGETKQGKSSISYDSDVNEDGECGGDERRLRLIGTDDDELDTEEEDPWRVFDLSTELGNWCIHPENSLSCPSFRYLFCFRFLQEKEKRSSSNRQVYEHHIFHHLSQWNHLLLSKSNRSQPFHVVYLFHGRFDTI